MLKRVLQFIMLVLLAKGIVAAVGIATCGTVLLFSTSAAAQTRGTTITAASCSQTDVQNAFNALTASTAFVIIPAGTCQWTTQVSLRVPAGSTNLTVMGAGNFDTTGGGDATVIVDNFVSDHSLLSITTGAASSKFRLAGITIRGGSARTDAKWHGVITIGGNSQNVRVDHVRINLSTYTPQLKSSGLGFYGALYGVVDHSIFEGPWNILVLTYQGGTFGDTSGNGDAAWANDTFLGSKNFMFFEDNTFAGPIGNDCTFGGPRPAM